MNWRLFTLQIGQSSIRSDSTSTDWPSSEDCSASSVLTMSSLFRSRAGQTCNGTLGRVLGAALRHFASLDHVSWVTTSLARALTARPLQQKPIHDYSFVSRFSPFVW